MASPAFVPPCRHPLACWVAARIAPIVLRRLAGVRRVSLPAPDLARLRALGGRSAVFTCNHPTQHEPAVVFSALSRAGLGAHYMAGRALFSALGPASLWLVRGAGAFSVRRGEFDADALRAARRLLADGGRLALFPEGETYGLSSTLLPFQDGVARLAFWGLQARRQADPEATLAVQPLAVFTTFEGNPREAIMASLARLERGLRLGASGSPYQRLLAVARAVAHRVEEEEGLIPDESLDLNLRIGRVFSHACERLAAELGLTLAAEATLPERLRALQAAANRQADSATGDDGRLREVRRHTARLQSFVAAREGYVSAWPSAERVLDQLGRLEREVLGLRAPSGERAGGDLVRVFGPRVAHMRVGAPLEAAERLAAWAAHREEAAAALTEAAWEETDRLLTGLEKELTQPLGWFM